MLTSVLTWLSRCSGQQASRHVQGATTKTELKGAKIIQVLQKYGQYNFEHWSSIFSSNGSNQDMLAKLSCAQSIHFSIASQAGYQQI